VPIADKPGGFNSHWRQIDKNFSFTKKETIHFLDVNDRKLKLDFLSN